MDTLSQIAHGFSAGGIWMWAIFVAQVISLAIIAERVFALYFQRQSDQMDLAHAFEEDIKKGQLDKVVTKSKKLSHRSPIGLVVQTGAQAAMDLGGRDEIQARMDEVLLRENSRFEKRIGFLAMLGNVGTLLGLLGTIVGMIGSFHAVSQANPIEKATLLAHHISIAMYCTAYGLVMAIPALVMFSVLQNRATHLAEDLNQSALKVFNWLSYSYETVPVKKTGIGGKNLNN
ncbi:MAG: MotA/TolQ/ExbB proton channel family protein [Bdellovibrionales bacterium]